MQFVRLPVTEESVPLSILGFGCAALLGRASLKQSQQAVGHALDAGITLFDTARSYGYGECEGLLGRIFEGRRKHVILCTKFGILPGARGGWKQRVKPVARAVVRVFPGLRKMAQRQAAGELSGGHFTVETLTASFDTSLRELRTDYVDMLLLHAAPVTALAADDLLEAMGRLVEQGKVRLAGISADLPVISQYFATRPPVLRTAQFALNLSLMPYVAETRANADLLLVANHPFGGPGGSALARLTQLAADPELPVELREKLSLRDPQLLPEVVLNCILRGTGIQAVVPAMLQPKHIAGNVRALEHNRFSDAELDVLRRTLGSAAVAATSAASPGGRQGEASTPSS